MITVDKAKVLFSFTYIHSPVPMYFKRHSVPEIVNLLEGEGVQGRHPWAEHRLGVGFHITIYHFCQFYHKFYCFLLMSRLGEAGGGLSLKGSDMERLGICPPCNIV